MNRMQQTNQSWKTGNGKISSVFFYSFSHLCTRIQFQLTVPHSRLPAALSDNECISHINSMWMLCALQHVRNEMPRNNKCSAAMQAKNLLCTHNIRFWICIMEKLAKIKDYVWRGWEHERASERTYECGEREKERQQCNSQQSLFIQFVGFIHDFSHKKCNKSRSRHVERHDKHKHIISGTVASFSYSLPQLDAIVSHARLWAVLPLNGLNIA